MVEHAYHTKLRHDREAPDAVEAKIRNDLDETVAVFQGKP